MLRSLAVAHRACALQPAPLLSTSPMTHPVSHWQMCEHEREHLRNIGVDTDKLLEQMALRIKRTARRRPIPDSFLAISATATSEGGGDGSMGAVNELSCGCAIVVERWVSHGMSSGVCVCALSHTAVQTMGCRHVQEPRLLG